MQNSLICREKNIVKFIKWNTTKFVNHWRENIMKFIGRSQENIAKFVRHSRKKKSRNSMISHGEKNCEIQQSVLRKLSHIRMFYIDFFHCFILLSVLNFPLDHCFKKQNSVEIDDIFWMGAKKRYSFGRDLKILGTNPVLKFKPYLSL